MFSPRTAVYFHLQTPLVSNPIVNHQPHIPSDAWSQQVMLMKIRAVGLNNLWQQNTCVTTCCQHLIFLIACKLKARYRNPLPSLPLQHPFIHTGGENPLRVYCRRTQQKEGQLGLESRKCNMRQTTSFAVGSLL